MSRIRLTWNNASTTIVEQRVYRSISPLDIDDMPDPLAVLPRRDREYLDSTIEDGLAYYYAVSSVLPDYSELISEEIKVEASPVEYDPHWDKVVALLHFDDGITDDTGRIWTPSGSVSVVANIGKFGGGLNFPTIPAYLQTPSSTDFSALSNGGKITIEFFVNPDLNDSSQLKYLICARGGASLANAWVVERMPDGLIGFVFWNSSQVQQPYASSGAGNIAAPGVFTHVVIEVDVSVVRIFLNGVLTSTTSITTPPDGANQTIFLGRSPVSSESSRNFRGVIDELRITKGVARYTENFTPPTEPFPNN